MKAILLIGGEGTRLRPLTFSYPKALIPIAGKTLIERIFLWLKSYGINEVVLTLGYKPTPIKKVFGSGEKLGLSIKYVYEKELLGTGGGLKNAEKFFNDTTVVLNGDIITDINLREVIKFHKKTKSSITITLVPVDDPTTYGLVKTSNRGRVKEFLEKPTHYQIDKENFINAGIYIIDPQILSYIQHNKKSSLERDVFPLLLKSNVNFFAYKARKNYWIDVGIPERLIQIHRDILSKKLKAKIPVDEKFRNVWLGKTKIHKSVKLFKHIYIGNNCKIGKNTQLDEFNCINDNVIIKDNAHLIKSLIYNNVKIGSNTQIENAIISPNVTISDNVIIKNAAILGKGTVLSEYSIL